MRNLKHDMESLTQLQDITPYRNRRQEMLRKLGPSLREKVLKAFAGFRTILGDDLDNFQKLSLLYQMVCEGGTYDYGTRKKSLSYSYLGALKGLAVCEGFTELFVLLVGELTESYTPYRISGYIAEDIQLVEQNDNGHAWVVIRDNDGNAWHFDPTWDLGKKQFRYFFKTDKEMRGRIWAAKFVPACTKKFDSKIYKNNEKLVRLVDYYKSMPQRFESGDFSVG